MKPILFNTEMVRAILEGRKTVTRRLIKHPYYIDKEDVCRKSGMAMHVGINITHGMPYPENPCNQGDILYVRETWCKGKITGEKERYYYKADYDLKYHCTWSPSIHMPKEAARIFLRVKNVRVERLQDISIEGIKAEGIDRKNILPAGCSCAWKTETCMAEPCANRDSYEYICWAEPFSELWNSTIKKSDLDQYGWNANPWIWANEFERISKEEALNDDV